MRELGWPLKGILEQEDFALPLAHAEADYRHPLRLDDLVEVELRIERIGKKSFTLSYRFLREGRECATALTRHVAVERSTGRPRPLPGELASALARYQVSSS